MPEAFGARLSAAVARYGPLCVGIDPHASLLASWGLPDDVSGLERFAATTVEAMAGQVAVVKPQSAFFERHGAAGVAVLERTIRDARDAGLLVLLDVKRGDIGSTTQAYAEAYLDPASPMAADAITVSPYLGYGSLAGTIELAEQEGRGVYVLALTANPEGRQVQHARTDGGRRVAEEIVDAAAAANAGKAYGNVGLVVGATIGATGIDLSQVHGSLLAPGIGAQGAGAAELGEVFGKALGYVLPSASRELLGAGPDPAQIRVRAEGMLAQMRSVLSVG
jgi:orotidine-5'-phosphate decarboxylase